MDKRMHALKYIHIYNKRYIDKNAHTQSNDTNNNFPDTLEEEKQYHQWYNPTFFNPDGFCNRICRLISVSITHSEDYTQTSSSDNWIYITASH